MQRYTVRFVSVVFMLAACNADAGDIGQPSTDGTLVVSTSTEGEDPDQDGYLLTVDGADSLALDPTGTVEVDVATGRHTLRLLGVTGHCSVTPESPLEVDIAPRSTTPVAFEVSCSMTGARVTVTATGLDLDPDGYHVEVDGADRGIVGSNGTVLIRLEPGSRTISLVGLSQNCTIDVSASRTVTIVDAEVVPLDFAVVCTATSGVIGIFISASGTSLEGTYQAVLDGSLRLSFSTASGLPAYMAPVPAGDHIVSLLAPAPCSVSTGPQSVTVTEGSLTRDTVVVDFSVTCVTPPVNITGNWQLNTGSRVTIAGSFTQSGSAVTGAVHVGGSNCLDSLVTLGVTGTVSGNNISLTSMSVGGQVITITGSFTGDGLAGTYAIDGGCASGDEGTLTGLRVPVINGTWRVNLSTRSEERWPGSATLTQGSASSEGSFGLTGTVSNSLSCFSGAITAGTFPSPSFIMGTSVVLKIKSNDGTVVVRGTVNQDGTKVIGVHRVFGGRCDGEFGGVCLGRSLQSSCPVPGFAHVRKTLDMVTNHQGARPPVARFGH